jgi:hypothetical protein
MASSDAQAASDRPVNHITNRIQQGLRAIFASALPLDLDLAARTLTPPQLAAFQRMTRGEQLHSLNVLRDVLAQGATPPELAVAALMHDVGKSRYHMRVWQKTLVVLVRSFAHPTYMKLIRESEQNWIARPFVVAQFHGAWGAEMLRELGASERTIWLVALHDKKPSKYQDHPDHDLLVRLQQADGAN